ncbi:hypothetical protein A9Y58_01358 [Streptococcus parauberis]|uniref:PASTA domain-containing protein n=1 Tax=Streptococcus parauberis TaxID=1348 RepID=UPI00097718EC|nr:PASTA domain-containing protein [Streptococcus parauberis]ONH63377.1 hypothetical protein ASN87_01258 [Streptococcus parauberis]PCH11710.1 hypothetical protein A9Y58_01358 [Streptococcus parauberis]
MVKKRRLTNSLGTLGKVISFIPDTTELIGKGMENTRPIVEKYMDQRHQRQENLRRLDDVVNISLDDAKAHIEKQGFIVATIPARPDKHYADCKLNEVITMSPKSGKYPQGSLVKLYFADLNMLEKSQELRDKVTLRSVEFNQKVADAIENVKHIKFPFNK